MTTSSLPDMGERPVSKSDSRLDERVLRRILDDEPIGVAICERVGSDFRYTYVNRAFQALKPGVPMLGRAPGKVPNCPGFTTTRARPMVPGKPPNTSFTATPPPEA